MRRPPAAGVAGGPGALVRQATCPNVAGHAEEPTRGIPRWPRCRCTKLANVRVRHTTVKREENDPRAC